MKNFYHLFLAEPKSPSSLAKKDSDHEGLIAKISRGQNASKLAKESVLRQFLPSCSENTSGLTKALGD